MALKIRKNHAPPPPHNCPLSECMEFLGGAWTPNIIWNLSACPRRFSELRVDIPGISAKVLTMRLRELEDKGVVAREVKPTSPPSVEYSLTELGRELVPAIDAIVRVGHKLKTQGKPRPRKKEPA
ncbi:MAG: winged helix-turn-helix transcriptional regulator [Hyphomicrobiales bacterium]